jgi:hypothetical protein
MAEQGVPGLAVALVGRDRCCGSREAEQQRALSPVLADSRFRVLDAEVEPAP